MVYVNANMDQQTNKKISTGLLTETLKDLCNETLYVTFVARKKQFVDEAWRDDGDYFLRVVLPYEEVLYTEKPELLAAQRLFQQLPLLNWLNIDLIRERLLAKIEQMQ